MSADKIDFSAKSDRELLIVTAQSVNEISEDIRALCTRTDSLERSRAVMESEIRRVESAQVLCRQEMKDDIGGLQAKKASPAVSETVLKYIIPLGIAMGAGIISAVVTRLGG